VLASANHGEKCEDRLIKDKNGYMRTLDDI
jgi:hypothetical protein